MLKPSQFTIATGINDTEVAVYNTLTNAFAILERGLWQTYEDDGTWEAHPHIDDLIKYGFLVPADLDEYQTFLLNRNKVKFYSGHLTFTVLTTFACNLACKYCMQSPVRLEQRTETDVVNNDTNALSTAEFIKKVVGEYQPNQITLTYFGGEPLANIEAITTLHNFLKEELPAKTQLNQMAITNGVLVPRYIDKLCQIGVSTLQITLDGPRQIHDTRRVGIGGAGTFDKVVADISAALEADIFVDIHIVIDSHNAPYTRELAQFLRQRFDKYLDRLAVNVGLASNPGWDSQHCALYISDSHATAMEFIQAVEAVLNEGLQIIDFLISSPCPRERDNEFIIAPDGGLYKCISAVGRDAFNVGNIQDTPLTIAHRSASLINFGAPVNECRRCPYLPYCNGGCRFNAWVRTGDVFSLDCWKEFHASSLPALLRLYAQTTSTSYPHIRRKVRE
jgi:uncharacterized protein